MQFGKCRFKIVAELVKGAGGGRFTAADENVVEPRLPLFGQHKAGNLAQTPFGAISGDGVADLF
jgi:hypothetical protein